MSMSVADLIKADHREFERLFAELKTPEQRPLIAPTLVALLAAHARAEEAEVLPKIDRLPEEEQARLASAFLTVRAEYLTAGATDLTRAELEQQARNEGISGTSSMNKSQLRQEVREDD
jgi:hemerythrin superfamily protein